MGILSPNLNLDLEQGVSFSPFQLHTGLVQIVIFASLIPLACAMVYFGLIRRVIYFIWELNASHVATFPPPKFERGISWALVRGISGNPILNRTSGFALVLVPILASVWPQLPAAATNSIFSFQGASEAPLEVSPEQEGFLKEDGESLTGDRTFDSSEIFSSAKLNIEGLRRMPPIWVAGYLASLFVLLGSVLFAVFAPEIVRKHSEYDFVRAELKDYSATPSERIFSLYLDSMRDLRVPWPRDSSAEYLGKQLFRSSKGVQYGGFKDWLQAEMKTPTEDGEDAYEDLDASFLVRVLAFFADNLDYKDGPREWYKGSVDYIDSRFLVQSEELALRPQKMAIVEEGARLLYRKNARTNLATATFSLAGYIGAATLLIGVAGAQITLVFSASL